MNAVNRITAAILEILLIFSAIIVLVVASGVAGDRVLPYGWFGQYLIVLNDLGSGALAATVLLCILTILVCLGLLFLQLSRVPRARPFLVRSDEDGDVMIEPSSVRLISETVGAEIHGVRQIRCIVRQRRGSGGLLIVCHPMVALGSNVPKLSRDMQNKVKETVESIVGLPVSEVSVAAKYEATRDRRLTPE
jgi:hypothetical protein